MKYEVQLTKKAKKEIDKLSQEGIKRINNALRNLIFFYDGKEVPQPDIKILKGKYQGIFRLRVGNIRIFLKMFKKELIILVIDVVPREQAYKG